MRLIDADAFLERMSRTDRFFGVVQSYRVIKCPEYECDLPEKYKNDGRYTKEVQKQ